MRQVQFHVGIQSDVSVRYAAGGGVARPPLVAVPLLDARVFGAKARRAHGAATAALLLPDAIRSLLQLDFVDDAQLRVLRRATWDVPRWHGTHLARTRGDARRRFTLEPPRSQSDRRRRSDAPGAAAAAQFTSRSTRSVRLIVP